MNTLSMLPHLVEQQLGVASVSLVQIFGDISCAIVAASIFFSKKTASNLKVFYCLIFLSFIALSIDDIYYNYMYRIMHYNIRNSTGILVTITFVGFQISQMYCWLLLIFRQKIKIFSQQNLSYLLCSSFVIYVLIYFFYSNQNYPASILIVQSVEVMIGTCVWLFAIICFANTTSRAISLLTLGSLIVISADLTSRCLYIFEPQELAYTMWVHVTWTTGVIIFLCGLWRCRQGDKFTFASQDSLQVTSSSRMVLTSFIAFTLGVFFLTLFRLKTDFNMHSILWGLPIVLMFTLIISISLAKQFSFFLVKPIDEILHRVNLFDSGKLPSEDNIFSKIDEFNILGNFINSTIKKLSTQLDRELKIAAQVAHDIRSPLSALQVLTEQKLTELEESKRILLRDAVYQIRDITNNLDQNALAKSTETQVAVLLEYVISERRATLTEKLICINQNFGIDAYSLFIKAPSSDLKRVLTNLINNSVEAIQSNRGVIDISLDGDQNAIVIIVSDNGCGIPPDLVHALFSRGFSTKNSGSGLGLFHARETIARFGGNIELSSESGAGTTITIKIPAQTPPTWFATQLIIPNHSVVVCVDDSISVWNAWQERFKSIKNSLELRYCSNKADLLHELEKNEHKPKTYLVDYEFSGQPYTGLHLIQIIQDYKKSEEQVLLVTSRSDEEIQEFCIENSLKIISKFFALKIPMRII